MNNDEQHPVSVEIDDEFDYPALDVNDCEVVSVVSAGLSHTAFVTEKGHVLTWGRNDSSLVVILISAEFLEWCTLG